MSYPHLSKAPIAEAVLDVAIADAATWGEEATNTLAQRFASQFPERRPLYQVQTQVEFKEQAAPIHSSQAGHLGYIFWNTDKSRAIQVRANGFSVNHVRGYEDWQALVTHAAQWWPDFVEAVAPAKVVRCSARFINQLRIPSGQDLSAVLRTRPEISSELPQVLDDYFQRLVLPFPNGVRATITQMVDPNLADESSATLVLDIDAAVSVSFDPSSSELWDQLEALRLIKNQCFFGSLQETKWKEYL